MTWRPAYSLPVLRSQIDAEYPNRDHGSDGIIGDATHSASVSDHNPDEKGVVHALDIDDDPDPDGGLHRIPAALIASRDDRIKYVISNGRIAYGNGWAAYFEGAGTPDWTWVTYYGDDPHNTHFHVSVVPDARADNTRPWVISGDSTLGGTSVEILEDSMSAQDVADLKKYLDTQFAALHDGDPTHPKTIGNVLRKVEATYNIVRTLPGAIAAQKSTGDVDVHALADALTSELGPDLGKQLVTALAAKLA